MKKKKLAFLGIWISTIMSTNIAYAGIAVAENGAKWIGQQVVWVIIGFIFIAFIKAIANKAWTQVIMTVVGGGVLAALALKPEYILQIGNQIFEILA